jgi:hypothetical protein
MTEYSKMDGSEADWVQPDQKERRFELRAGDALLGSLSFRSDSGTMALAESARGKWTYKRVGFLNTRVTIREEGSDEDLAVFKPNVWGNGVLTFGDGSKFRWKTASLWKTAWVFTDSAGQALIHFKPGSKKKLRDGLQPWATVNIEPYTQGDPRLAILLTLGIYILTAQQGEDEESLAALFIAIS